MDAEHQSPADSTVYNSCVNKIMDIQSSLENMQHAHDAQGPMPHYAADQSFYMPPIDQQHPADESYFRPSPPNQNHRVDQSNRGQYQQYDVHQPDYPSYEQFAPIGHQPPQPQQPRTSPTEIHPTVHQHGGGGDSNSLSLQTFVLLFPLCFGGLLLTISHQVLLWLTQFLETWMRRLWHAIRHGKQITPPNGFSTWLPANSPLVRMIWDSRQMQRWQDRIDHCVLWRVLLVIPLAVLLSLYVGLWMTLQLNAVLVTGVPADRAIVWLEANAPALRAQMAPQDALRY